MAETAESLDFLFEDQSQFQSDDPAVLLRERLRHLVGNLEKEAEDRVSKRELIEKRWLEDIRQYHGHYDEKTLRDLRDSKKSLLFINQTRPKTNACDARLSDMLFPTDDRNWGIGPTPVPELTVESENIARQVVELKMQAAQSEGDQQLQQQAAEAEKLARMIQARMDEARKRAKAMEEDIADDLKHCRYNIQARDVIRDACKLGTGVMKGPITGGKFRRGWKQREDGVYELQPQQDNRPVYWRADPWHFFPEMDAADMDECESVFERHLMNDKMLRRLAKDPSFDKNAIRRLLRDKPRSSIPTFIADLRTITGAYHDMMVDRYHVWEYHGPITAENLRDLASIYGDEKLVSDVGVDGDVDPLEEISVIIWFCQGEILKFGIHSLDSDEHVYSVFNLEKDETSIFGFGIPFLMRDSQSALSAAWRTMLDNAGLSSGPQIVIDENVIEPYNGVVGLEPRKLWKKKSGVHPQARPFETYDIPMHQAEMANIIELAKRNIDEETSIPIIAMGEQGSHVTQTAHGMNILINAVNVVFRRIVKNWDDDMTVPNIRRIYDWKMQFSPKQHIKGDFEVDARGSSVLLVREMQSANLMVFLTNFGAHPILSKYLKDEGLPALRHLARTMMIPADELIKTDTEVQDDAAAAASQPPPPDPEMEKIAMQLNVAEIDRETKVSLALIQRDTAMMQLAAQQNMKLEDIRAMLFSKDMEIKSKERMMVSEAALEQRLAKQGGNGNGSGGHFSVGSKEARPQ